MNSKVNNEATHLLPILTCTLCCFTEFENVVLKLKLAFAVTSARTWKGWVSVRLLPGMGKIWLIDQAVNHLAKCAVIVGLPDPCLICDGK